MPIESVALGKAYSVVARARLASSFFLIERYRPLPDAAAVAGRLPPVGNLGTLAHELLYFSSISCIMML